MPIRQDLERWAGEWVEREIISADQRDQILALEYGELAVGRRLEPIFALLGAGLLVLGLVFVVAQNWDEIDRMTKLVAGVVLLVGFLTSGYWVRFGSLDLRKTGEGLMLVGTGVFLGDLALISQQYHIVFNPSPLFLPVLLSAVAFAYLLTSRAYAAIAAGMAVVWLIFESQRDGSALRVDLDVLLVLLVGAAGWLVAIAELQRRTRFERLAGPVEVVGGLLLFVVVYALGFYRFFEVYVAAPSLPAGLLLLAPTALVGAALLVTGGQLEEGLGWPAIPDRVRPAILLAEFTLLLMLVWSFIVAVGPRGDAEQSFILYTFGYWVGALLMVVCLAWLGLVLRRGWWVNGALLFLGVFVLTRYLDLFSDYEETGLVFAGAGVLFLALAFGLERSRRVLTATMAGDGDALDGAGEA